MSEINPAGIRIAVEFLTLWMEQDQLSAATHIAAVLDDPYGPGAPSIIASQLDLGVILVLMLAQARGATADDMGMMASEILREVYRDLAE